MSATRRIAEWNSSVPASRQARSIRYPTRSAASYSVESGPKVSRRWPCPYDPASRIQGYGIHSFAGDDDLDDYDERGVNGCELRGGSGNYDPLPQLLALSDDKAAERWVAEELPRSSGPAIFWTNFPEAGRYYDALGYNRNGKGTVRGVTDAASPETWIHGSRGT
jgi:hypothetical protein